MNKLQAYTILRNARIYLPGILFSICCISCKNDIKDIEALVGKTTMQEDKAYDVTIMYSEDGRTTARIFSKEFVRNDVAKPPFIDMKNGMKVEFFGDSLKAESTLTARYARYYEQRGTVLIRDSIRVVNRKGERLETDELVWNRNVKKFYTEKFVKIHTATQILFGDGLEANEDFTWYIIKNPRGVVQVDKSEMPE